MDAKQQLSDALDEALLNSIRHGQVVLDANGNPVTISPSAKMLEVAIKRLSQLGVTNEVTTNGRQAEIIKQLRQNGLRFRSLPPIKGDEDIVEDRETA